MLRCDAVAAVHVSAATFCVVGVEHSRIQLFGL